MDRRVVITGVGTINPLGSGEEFWNNLTNGVSGVGLITKFDTKDFRCKIGAEVKYDPKDFGFTSKDIKRLDSFSIYTLIASELALKDSGLDLTNPRENAGVIIGTGVGGVESIEKEDERIFTGTSPKKVSPLLVSNCMPNAAAAQVSIKYGFEGPSFAVISACAAGTTAIISAAGMIRDRTADIFVTGGAEAAFVRSAYASFANLRALNNDYNDDPQKASMPFDAKRSGFVYGEGAGIIILEELEHAKARSAKIYAELTGYGMTSDAFHITAPREDRKGMRRAMQIALRNAGVNLDEMDYINAHGTSTPFNDKAETDAIKQVFGDYAYTTPISSTKSMTGHLLGAAGGLEAVISVLALDRGIIPPTINYETKDPDCDLDYTPNEAREANLKVVMSNSFGFGGHNASIVLRKYEE